MKHPTVEDAGSEAPADRERTIRNLVLEQPKRVLIVDDDYDSIRLLERTLLNHNCMVQIATDGPQAVRLLIDNPFDLVFLDWMMPKLQGGETIEVVDRQLAKNKKITWTERLPVVTFSCYDRRELKLPPSSHFAFIDHWQKPMGYEILYANVKEVLTFVDLKGH